MISLELAIELQRAGLTWRPQPGDRFAIPQPDLIGEVFTLSEMTIEAHAFPGGTVLGFNGTTEWALDSVMLDETVWLPREDQLREMLGGAFRGLRQGQGDFAVTVTLPVNHTRLWRRYVAADPAEAYARAVLDLLRLATT